MDGGELELTFLLAGTRERRSAAADRIASLAGEVDYDALASDLGERRLLALLGSRLIEAAPAAVPDSFAGLVRAFRARSGMVALALDAAGIQLVRRLEAGGVRTMRLKGPGLAQAAHGDIAMRSAGDIDLLVVRDDLERAIELTMEQGYGSPIEGLPGDDLPTLHFTLNHPDRPRVEIHWRVHWHEEQFSRDLLERAKPGTDGLLEPTTADMATTLLLVYARDGFYGLRMAADIAAWFDRQLPDGPQGLLDSHLDRYPELSRSLQAAALAAESVAGVPAATWLSDPRTDELRVRLATRLVNWDERGDRGQLFANLALVDGLLSPPGAHGDFLRRELATGPEGEGRLAHLTRRFGREITGLWQIRRGPWSPIPPSAGA